MTVWQKIKLVFQPKNFETVKHNEQVLYAGINPLTQLGTELTKQELISLSYFTKGVQIIANDIAKVTFNVQKKEDNHWINQDHTKLHFLLNRSPNSNLTAFEFKRIIIWNLFLYNKAPIYVHYERDQIGKYQLIDLIPIFPEWINREYDDSTGKYRYIISTNPIGGTSSFESNNMELNDDEIIWIDYEIIQGVMDVSFSSLFKGVLAKLKENELTLLNSIKNDTGSTIMVKVPDITNKTQREELQTSLNSMIAAQKKHGSVVFVGDLKWDISAQNITSSKINYETRNAIAREAASMLGLPPSKLGVEDSNKYNSLVERHKAYVEEALRPVLNNIITKFTNWFFPDNMNQRINIKQLDLISLDTKTLQEFASSAINNGYATSNEIRELFGFEYHKDGNYLLANGSLTDVGLSHLKTKVEVDLLKLQLKQAKEPKPIPSETGKEPTEEIEEETDKKDSKNK